jgi:hypothetical protein
VSGPAAIERPKTDCTSRFFPPVPDDLSSRAFQRLQNGINCLKKGGAVRPHIGAATGCLKGAAQDDWFIEQTFIERTDHESFKSSEIVFIGGFPALVSCFFFSKRGPC